MGASDTRNNTERALKEFSPWVRAPAGPAVVSQAAKMRRRLGPSGVHPRTYALRLS